LGRGNFPPPKKKILGINTVCSRPATPAGAALLTLIELEKYFGRHSHCLTLESFVNFTVLCAKKSITDDFRTAINLRNGKSAKINDVGKRNSVLEII